MTRLAKCCHIVLEETDERIDVHYHDGLCRLCGESMLSSKLRAHTVIDRQGNVMPCPLCHAGVLSSQLTRHADDLASLQDAAQALLRLLEDRGKVVCVEEVCAFLEAKAEVESKAPLYWRRAADAIREWAVAGEQESTVQAVRDELRKHTPFPY